MATFYFNGAVDGDWQTLGNWWMDSDHTVAATALPTSADSVIAVGNIDTNSGSEPTVVNFTMDDPGEEYVYNIMSVSVTVTGTATFNGSSSLFLGTVTGDATFNDSASSNGTVSGNATFNDSSYNEGYVGGDATFNDYSSVGGWSVTLQAGSLIFNDYSTCYGNTYGPHIFNDGARAAGGSTLYGDVTFTNSTFSFVPFGPQAVDGTVTFSSPTPVSFVIYGYEYWMVNASAWNFVSPNPTWTFNDSSALIADSNMYAYGTIPGNATFNDNSYNGGIVNGDATFRGQAYNQNGITGTVTLAYEKGINGSSILGVI